MRVHHNSVAADRVIVMLVGVVVLIGIGLLFSGCASSTLIKKTGDRTVDAILETAQQQLEVPYCASGNTPDCFDCSGFVFYCFSSARVSVPRTTSELFAFGSAVSMEYLKPGDLVFFNTSGKGVSHVGIFIGEGNFIHSSTTKGVMISLLNDPYWNPRFLGSRRMLSQRVP